VVAGGKDVVFWIYHVVAGGKDVVIDPDHVVKPTEHVVFYPAVVDDFRDAVNVSPSPLPRRERRGPG
jgi:hypothetical protein